MRNDITVIYYTSNREDPVFEEKIKNKLVSSMGDLPLISVSHEPIDFGKNICIGKHTPCDDNLYKQVLIGCEAAKTPFVIMAEADFIYPPEYFNFRPPTLDMSYRYSNLWIMTKNRNRFKRKRYSAGCQIVGREYYIERLKMRLKQSRKPIYEFVDEATARGWEILDNWAIYETTNPCVSIKTGNGLRKYTGVMEGERGTRSLPFVGKAEYLRRELFPELFK